MEEYEARQRERGKQTEEVEEWEMYLINFGFC